MKEIRKKLLMFSGLFLLAGFLGTAAYAVPSGPIGDIDNADRNATWAFVYNNDTVAHEAGDVLVWADGSHDGLDVSSTTTANNGLVAGAVPSGQTLAASSWGWLQTSGYHPAITIGVANAAGDWLVTSSTPEAAGVYSVAQATGTSTNESNINGAFAVALAASTSSDTVKGFLKCN